MLKDKTDTLSTEVKSSIENFSYSAGAVSGIAVGVYCRKKKKYGWGKTIGLSLLSSVVITPAIYNVLIIAKSK